MLRSCSSNDGMMTTINLLALSAAAGDIHGGPDRCAEEVTHNIIRDNPAKFYGLIK